MKQNPNFILRTVADTQVLVPVGEAAKSFPGMVTMNDTSVFLWERLSEEQTTQSLADALVECYDVSREQAQRDTESYVRTLREFGAILA